MRTFCTVVHALQDRQYGSAVSRVNRTVTCRGDVKERWANVRYVLQCEKTLTDTHVRVVRAIGTVVYGTVQYKTETGLRYCTVLYGALNRTVTCRGDVKERWANVRYYSVKKQ